MKISEYKQMKAWLTRPGDPQNGKKIEEANQKYLAHRKAKTLKEYGLNEDQLNSIGKRVLEYSNINKPDNSNVVVVNGDLKTENQLKEEIEKVPSTIAEYHKQKQDKKVVKPIVKKTLKPETLNLHFEPLPDLTVQRSAEDIEAEKRFRQLEAEIKQEKINRNTKGLMSFAPGVKI